MDGNDSERSEGESVQLLSDASNAKPAQRNAAGVS